MTEANITLNVGRGEPPPPPKMAPQGSRQGTSPSAGSQISATGSATSGQVKEFAERINDQLQRMDGQFSVSVDDESGMVIVRITDSDTGEVVKQIPPQQILDADVSVDKIIGLLVNDQA
jgi:flagellar protein FlaG